MKKQTLGVGLAVLAVSVVASGSIVFASINQSANKEVVATQGASEVSSITQKNITTFMREDEKDLNKNRIDASEKGTIFHNNGNPILTNILPVGMEQNNLMAIYSVDVFSENYQLYYFSSEEKVSITDIEQAVQKYQLEFPVKAPNTDQSEATGDAIYKDYYLAGNDIIFNVGFEDTLMLADCYLGE